MKGFGAQSFELQFQNQERKTERERARFQPSRLAVPRPFLLHHTREGKVVQIKELALRIEGFWNPKFRVASSESRAYSCRLRAWRRERFAGSELRVGGCNLRLQGGWAAARCVMQTQKAKAFGAENPN